MATHQAPGPPSFPISSRSGYPKMKWDFKVGQFLAEEKCPSLACPENSPFSSSRSETQCWVHPSAGLILVRRRDAGCGPWRLQLWRRYAQLAGLCADAEFPQVQSSAADFVPCWKTLPLTAFWARFHSCRREGFSSFSLRLFLISFLPLSPPTLFLFLVTISHTERKQTNLTARSPG